MNDTPRNSGGVGGADTWRHPPAYPVWDGQIIGAMRMQHRAPEAKVVYVETAGGMAAVMMCNEGHEPRRTHGTIRGDAHAYVRGDARKTRRELMRYACLLAEEMSVHNDSGRCRWEVRGPAALAGVLDAERRAVVRERAAWLHRHGGRRNRGWNKGGRVVVWAARGNSTTVAVLPAKSATVAVAACKTDDTVIVAPAVGHPPMVAEAPMAVSAAAAAARGA